MNYQLDEGEEEDDSDWSEDVDETDDPNIAGIVDTKPCPFCKKPIYDQAEMCTHCGAYISEEDSSSRKPLWTVIAVVVLVSAILLGWVMMW